DFLATPGVLKLLVYQALMPQLCSSCALPFSAAARGDCGYDWGKWAAAFARAHQLEPGSLRARNPQGCAACRRAGLPQLNGLAGRTVVAEMIEPGQDDGLLIHVRRRDNLGLLRYVRSRPRTPLQHPDMTGKSAAECALYKVALGQRDPRPVASHFRLPGAPPGMRAMPQAEARDAWPPGYQLFRVGASHRRVVGRPPFPG